MVSTAPICLAEGDLPPRRPAVVPGHEIVGRVGSLGARVSRFAVDDRIGIPWFAGYDGSFRFCRRGDENLCPSSTDTGWDADGGYADTALADQNFAYPLPDGIRDEQAAPLLCAGIIEYRSLRATQIPPGGSRRRIGDRRRSAVADARWVGPIADCELGHFPDPEEMDDLVPTTSCLRS